MPIYNVTIKTIEVIERTYTMEAKSKDKIKEMLKGKTASELEESEQCFANCYYEGEVLFEPPVTIMKIEKQ